MIYLAKLSFAGADLAKVESREVLVLIDPANLKVSKFDVLRAPQ